MPEFTAQQRDAIDYRKLDACVMAGPGSGKTTVLVERFYSLVEEHRFDPDQILAITFTEKAAANMKAKLAEKFEHDELRLRELESAWVSTIHGFCARLLRENAIAAGIDPRFQVLDARESDDLQFECFTAALDELIAERRAEGLALIEALPSPVWIAGELKSAYDAIRSAGRSIESVRAMPSPLEVAKPIVYAQRLMEALRRWPAKITPLQATHRSELYELARDLSRDFQKTGELLQVVDANRINLRRVPRDANDAMKALRDDLDRLISKVVDIETAPFREIIFDVLARFEVIYNERKEAAGALDFNDLERRSIELLRAREAVRDRVRAHFRQVMLDEYQDINEQQSELISLIRGEEVFFGVGDVNQSIYGFRHARPEIFRGYRDATAANGKHSVELTHNFRSRGEILQFVGALLNGSEGIEARELTAGKKFPEKSPPSIEVIKTSDEDKDEASVREARWMAHRILSMGNPFRDFAVLCRNGESMQPILDEFEAAGIPYVCGRRQSFLLSREGLDIRALLHVVVNPRDGIALATVLRSPLVGLRDETLLHLRFLGGSVNGGLNMVAFDPSCGRDIDADELRRVLDFASCLKRWRADAGIVPLDVLISRMLSDCGHGWRPGSVEGENIEAFLQLARTRGANRPLLDFLRELESIESAVSTESDLSDEDSGNRVQVMTAHAAKGLEFPVTIIAGMEKGTRTGTGPVSFTPQYGLGIKWKDAASKDGLEDSWALKNAECFKQREDEEANRLLYVAMTRAEDHLILSYSRSKTKPSNWAKKVEEFFDVPQEIGAGEPVTVEAHGVIASILVAGTDPPRLTARDRDREQSTEIAEIPRPVIGDQYDTAVNVTSLTAFANCPRRYYIERYLGWSGAGTRGARKVDPEELPAAELGSLVHEVLAGRPGPHPDEALSLAAVFQRSDLGHRAEAALRREREWDFIADVDGTLIRGTIDLWFEDAAGIHIVDYKTDTTIKPGEYAPQVALYAMALERAFGSRPVSASLHYLKHDVVERVDVGDPAIEGARELIRALRDAQEQLKFEMREGEHCRACPWFRASCPASLT